MYVWKEYEIGWIGRWGKGKNVIKIEFLKKKINTIFKKRKRPFFLSFNFKLGSKALG